jgi:hypothetical protein
MEAILRKLCSVLATALVALLVLSMTMGASRTVQVPCGSDIDAKINADSSTISTRFVLGSCISNPYIASATVVPQNGDEVAGPVGTFTARGLAQDPSTTTIIRGAAGLAQVMKPKGTVSLEWITVEGGDFNGGTGTGVGIAGGAMSSASNMFAVTVRNNEGAGLSNMNGSFDSIELTNNTTNSQALGFIGSGGKAINEVSISRAYVHDTQGNGLWCDEFCHDSSLGKYIVRDSLVVNNGREGIRWERVGSDTGSGEALIERNEVHGNGHLDARYGIGARDAANAVIQNNVFGAKTIAGIAYPKNNLGAIRASDSGRSDRPNLFNIDILNNTLNGETIKGCELADSIVYCSGNTN